MNRRRTVSLLVACAATFLPARADAQKAWLSLNLAFNTQGDFGSGGVWTIVGKSDSLGLAAVNVYLANATTFTDYLAPPEFNVRFQGMFGSARNVLVAHNLTNPYPLGAGLIGSSFPSTYVDPPGLSALGGYSDVGSFTGGMTVAKGTFAPGVIPDWTTQGSLGNESDANVFTAPYPAAATNADTTLTVLTVRYFFAFALPEPSGLSLVAWSAMGVTTMVRRRSRRP